MLMNALLEYQETFVARLKENMAAFGPSSKLRDACEYVLMNGGKRMRPAFVMMIADALGHGADVTQAALAIEYCHTASLVADDLPCMDDDDFRRNKPTVHKVYGEDVALLVSYALIAASYGCLEKNAEVLRKANLPHSVHSDRICVLALQNAAYNTGINGAVGGQYIDIYPPDLTRDTLREVLHKKTVSLFEIAFVFGWLYGGGDIAKLPTVKKAAAHFGMAFQIADDLDDLLQDKQGGHKVNYAAVCGVDEAKKMVKEETEGYERALKELGLTLPRM